MKIVQIAPFYYPKLGGVEEVVKKYSEGLVRRGHSVEVITSDIDSDKRKNIDGVSLRRLSSIRIPSNLPYTPITPSLPWRILRSKADIYHIHANKRFTSDLSSLVLKLARRKTIFSPHAGQFGSSFLGQLHNSMLGSLTMSSDRVICVSEYEKELITKAGFKANFRILPNGVDLNEFASGKKSFYDSARFKNKKILLTVCRLTAHKKVDLIIKAMAKLPTEFNDLVLVVVGPDEGELSNLREFSRSLGIEEKVVFMGKLSREELINAYASADLFCLASVSEAFGIAVVEAMAARVPVIGVDKCAIPELIEDKVTGLLAKDTPDSIAEKITTILENEGASKKLVAKAFAKVRDKYNWEVIVPQLESIYEEVV